MDRDRDCSASNPADRHRALWTAHAQRVGTDFAKPYRLVCDGRPCCSRFLALLFSRSAAENRTDCILFAFWVADYINRSLMFPWRVRIRPQDDFPCYHCVVGFHAAGMRASMDIISARWRRIRSVGFGMGASSAALQTFLDWSGCERCRDESSSHSDRAETRTEHAIPRGGLFEIVFCLEIFLVKIVEWSGFALMGWNLPALSFAIWTAANLIPGALSHHAWYRQHFSDYPRNRSAVIPLMI